MTLIQCFDLSRMGNLAACLRLRPEKWILLGEDGEMQVAAEQYRKILAARHQNTRICLESISGFSMTQITALLSRLIRREGECVIDLTGGGQEQVVMALGAVLAGLDEPSRRRISVQKYDLEKDVDVDCDGDGQVIPGRSVSLSVAELIMLFDGKIHPSTYQPSRSDSPSKLEPLWQVVRDKPKDWNRRMSVLGAVQNKSCDKMDIDLSWKGLKGAISNFLEKKEELDQLLTDLDNAGVIKDRSDSQRLCYSYTDPLYRYCTQKAGNVLEVKALLEARSLREDGKPFFSDCRTSVSIDWDGKIHRPVERVPETRNEMDLVLMRGLTPLFISCKNGNIGDEELYKLHTVADYFGGPHARKMLIATDLDRGSQAANRAFGQRAWDMDIFLVTDAAELTQEEWAEAFREAIK